LLHSDDLPAEVKNGRKKHEKHEQVDDEAQQRLHARLWCVQDVCTIKNRLTKDAGFFELSV
jgi:hypothetical protein